jgi:hypothetical protein
MNEREIRLILVDGLEAGAVHQVNDVSIRESFLAGTRDLSFAELEMDSLAKMELCIAIEVGTGVSLAPEELGRFAAIGEIVTMLRERLHA